MEFEKLLESDVPDSDDDVGWVIEAGVGEVSPKSIEALALAVTLRLAVVLAITLAVKLSELDRVSVAYIEPDVVIGK